jgi:hypothetical protein
MEQIDRLMVQVAQLSKEGRYQQALPVAQHICDLTHRVAEAQHPDFAASLTVLAGYCRAMGNLVTALPLDRQALEITRAALGEDHPGLARSLNNLALLYQGMGEYAAALPPARQALEVKRAALGEAHPDFATGLDNLATLYRDIGEAADPRDEPGAEVAGCRRPDHRPCPAGGAALVEFVRFLPLDFKAVPARGEQHWQPPRYLAFVLPAGDADRVRLIDVGEAEPIDRLPTDFRAGVTGEAEVRDLAKVSRPPAEDAGASPGESLRATVFDPLADALGACRRLFLAPDGDLTRLPFEALPLPDGRHLLDAYSISYVSVGRDLLRFSARSNRPPARPRVVADPDFDLGVNADRAGAGRGGAASPAPRKGLWAACSAAAEQGPTGFSVIFRPAERTSSAAGRTPRAAGGDRR